MKNKSEFLKNNKGSIVLFVLIGCMFFCFAAISINMNISNKSDSQLQGVSKIESEYKVTDEEMRQVYEEKLETQDLGSAEFTYKGVEETYIIEETGTYYIEIAGASGSGGNIFETTYIGTGGKGAKMTATFELKKSDVLHIIVGGEGTTIQATAKNGTSGGGGGGTFIFKEIPSVTDSKYQFTKNGVAYEVLLVAAGGGGSQDCANKGANSTGYNGQGAEYFSPNNYTSYSTTTNAGTSSTSTSGVLGINQYISYNLVGSFYIRSEGRSQGGYGGGGSSDDSYAFGGGWAKGTNTHQAKSWSLDTNAVGVDGANQGNGYARIMRK